MFLPCCAALSQRTVIALATIVSTFMLCSRAQASDVEACIAAHEHGQLLRNSGKLKEAREEMLSCSRDVCPSMIRKECAPWLAEIDQSIPSIVVAVRGPDGRDAVEARVSLDGKPLLTRLDGRSVLVDPGEHVLRVEWPGQAPKEERFVLREGEKNRALSISFAVAKPVTSADSRTLPPDVPHARPMPTVSYVLGGVGVAALAASVFFESKGLSQRSDLDSQQCKPYCNKSDVDSAKQSILIGDMSLGVGILSLGAATYFYLTRPSVPVAAQKAWVPEVNFSATQAGASAQVRTSF
jgi:hypothetical protein